jgi:hypothetical protein
MSTRPAQRQTPESGLGDLEPLLRLLLEEPERLDPAAIAQLRARAPQLIAALERSDASAWNLTPEAARAWDEHAPTIFEALAIDLGAGEEPIGESELWVTHEHDKRSLGEAFALLMAYLPSGVDSLASRLVDLPPVSDSLQTELRAEADVTAAPDSLRIVPFGLTPVSVLSALRGLELLFDRAIDAGLVPREHEFRLAEAGLQAEASQLLVDRRQLTNEIAITARCVDGAAGALYDWALEAAAYQQRLFDGFCTSRVGHAIAVRPIAERSSNLLHRWSRIAPATCR